jgi:hypothetical protein
VLGAARAGVVGALRRLVRTVQPGRDAVTAGAVGVPVRVRVGVDTTGLGIVFVWSCEVDVDMALAERNGISSCLRVVNLLVA